MLVHFKNFPVLVNVDLQRWILERKELFQVSTGTKLLAQDENLNIDNCLGSESNHGSEIMVISIEDIK